MPRQSIDTTATGDTIEQGFNKSEANFSELYEGKADKAGEGWRNAALLNGTQAYLPSSYGTPSYLKDPFGFVHFRGMIVTPVLNTVNFVLDADCRPPERVIALGMTAAGGVRIDIGPDGQLKQVQGTTNWCSLSPVQFKAVEA